MCEYPRNRVSLHRNTHRGIEQLVACHFDLVEVGDSSSSPATIKPILAQNQN